MSSHVDPSHVHVQRTQQKQRFTFIEAEASDKPTLMQPDGKYSPAAPAESEEQQGTGVQGEVQQRADTVSAQLRPVDSIHIVTRKARPNKGGRGFLLGQSGRGRGRGRHRVSLD